MFNVQALLLTLIEMNAIGIFGFVCLILVCFGLPIELIIDAYKKPGNKSKRRSRNLTISNISKWDYLIVILPVWLLLIIIFSNDYSSKIFSMVILGIGYSGLIISSYNKRIDILKINLMLFSVSAMLAITAIGIIYFTKYDMTDVKEVKLLYAPLITYCYLLIARQIIKQLTGTYPITLDRYYSVGNFHDRYSRKTNYWDLGWSFFNMIVLGIIVIICFK